MSFFQIFIEYYCVISTLIRMTMPVKDIKKIHDTKMTHKFPYFVLIFAVMNSIFWIAYWHDKYNSFLIFISIYGSIVNMFFLVVFINCLDIKCFDKMFFSLFSIMIPTVILLTWMKLDYSRNVKGTVAIIFNTMVFVSPFQKIVDCIKNQDHEYIPIFISFINFFSSLGFVFYAVLYLSNDIYLLIPHSSSLVLSSLQFFFYLKYYKINKIEIPENKANILQQDFPEKLVSSDHKIDFN